MNLDLGIYDRTIDGLENFEMNGDSLARTRAAAKKIAEWEEANCD